MPDSFKHNVSLLGAGQATKKQCWYASFRMITKLSKQAVKDKLVGGGIDFDDAMANGLLDTDYQKAANALDLETWSGEKFKQAPGFFDIGLTDGAEAFIELLKVRPLWVSRFIEQGSYHAVVAVGYNDDGKGYIIFNNPYPGPDNAIEDATMPANIFVKHITSAKGSVMRAKS
ncbi:MAG TPA: papain-like cysteine protease family protein [Pyrinomonadaceae bacterium]